MARIELDLAHAYLPNPKQDSDYALLPLKMTFEDGGAYALLGPSGCGKTTLLNIMSGLVTPSQGTVKFDGREVTSLSPQERKRLSIGVIAGWSAMRYRSAGGFRRSAASTGAV